MLLLLPMDAINSEAKRKCSPLLAYTLKQFWISPKWRTVSSSKIGMSEEVPFHLFGKTGINKCIASGSLKRWTANTTRTMFFLSSSIGQFGNRKYLNLSRQLFQGEWKKGKKGMKEPFARSSGKSAWPTVFFFSNWWNRFQRIVPKQNQSYSL